MSRPVDRADAPPHLLPTDRGLDVGALSRLFDDTTNSYKHLFFEALLGEFRDGGFAGGVFPLDALAVGMLAAAWHPARVYRLSLGLRDQAAEVLARIELGEDGPVPARQLKAALAARDPDCRAIMRWVPYRLISPFFAQRLRGMPDHHRNALIRSLADELFDSARPLYRFVGSGAIELHPEWAAYLAANFPIVAAWAERRWIAYLQSRNPTVPAVSEKTGPPLRRDSLTAQTRYWRKAIVAMAEPPSCIYSGTPLDPDRFHLDHFLPWTFVCHDALWNLLPVSPKANSSKGNKLPDPSYLPRFAAAQHAGLAAARRVMGRVEWETATGPFVGDLRIPEANLLDPAVLAEAYDRSVRAQLDIAHGIGFEAGWRFAAEA